MGMFVAFCLLLVLSLIGIKFSKFHESYVGVEQATCIKGIFTAVVLLSHLRQYIEIKTLPDSIVEGILNLIGQLMVAVFFFYSGFGIIQSKWKKTDYTKTFLKSRFLKTLVHFDVAVFCYFLLSLAMGTQYSLTDYLFCWIGWTAIGNSNWFVFVMLCMYIITAIAFSAEKKIKTASKTFVPAFVGVGSLLLWVALLLLGKEGWWYTTLLCYPFGMLFALLEKRLYQIFVRQSYRILLTIAAFLAFAVLYLTPGVLAYSICACLFCFLIVLFNTWVKVENSVLRFLGKHTFTIYILQRIPMILAKEAGLDKQQFLFVSICVVSTIALAVLFEKIYKKSDQILFS